MAPLLNSSFIRTISMLCLMAATFSFQTAFDAGVHGPTYDIQEEDFLDVIKSRIQKLSKEKILEYNLAFEKRVHQSIKNPAPAATLPRSTTYERHLMDPSIVVQQDIKTAEGKSIALKGTRVNPLKIFTERTGQYMTPLLFIDGDDEDQVKWAFEVRQPKNNAHIKGEGQKHKALLKVPKIVLLKGSPLKLENDYKCSFYHDQNGSLLKRFQLKRLPAKVSQEGDYVLIEEIPVDGGDA